MDASSRISQFREFRAPLGSKGARAESQEKRRQDALTRQREQRRQAFSFGRDGWEQVADALSDSEDDEGDLTHGKDSTLEVLANGGNPASHADESSMLAEPTSVNQAAFAPQSEAHGSLPKRIKKKWRSYADKLMQGEALDLSDETGGLPADLFSDWLALGPVPKGKRCLAVTFSSMRMSSRGRMTNTLLLARQTGRPLARHLVPSLPPDCVLDCIYSEAHAALFVLDLLRWKSQSISESEAEFRMFWRDSKLSELGPQILSQPAPPAQEALRENGDSAPTASGTSRKGSHGHKPAQLIVLPVPCSPAPLNPHSLVNDVVQPTCAHATATISFLALVPPAAETQGEQRASRKQQMSSRNTVAQTVSMEYEIDGLLLLVKSASYESGLTPLAAWISKDELPRLGQALVIVMQ